jgi:hypothetical protein
MGNDAESYTADSADSEFAESGSAESGSAESGPLGSESPKSDSTERESFEAGRRWAQKFGHLSDPEEKFGKTALASAALKHDRLGYSIGEYYSGAWSVYEESKEAE